MLPIPDNSIPTAAADVDASQGIGNRDLGGTVGEPFDAILSEQGDLTPLQNVDPVPIGIEPVPIEMEPVSLNAEPSLEQGSGFVGGKDMFLGGKGLPLLPPAEGAPLEKDETSPIIDAPAATLLAYSRPSAEPYNDALPNGIALPTGQAAVVGRLRAGFVADAVTQQGASVDAPGYDGVPIRALVDAPVQSLELQVGADPEPVVPKQSMQLASAQLAISSAAPLIGGAEALATGKMGASLAASSSPVMSTPLGDPQWNSDLAGRVSVMMKNGTSEATLLLSPPELGRLEIKIATEGDQAKIQFVVHSLDAKEAIELAMPRLRDMLGQVGLQLAQGEVADQSQSRQGESHIFDSLSNQASADVDETLDTPMSMRVVHEATSLIDYYV